MLLTTGKAFSQDSSQPKKSGYMSGAVTATNNGISLIPTFSLGDPAAIFNLNLGRKKLSFEPELRFALAGKPWSFLFWWRYKVVNAKKFSFRLGMHPALNFRTETIAVNGVYQENSIARRYLAWELVPNYYVGKKVSLGMYYLVSWGLDAGTVSHTHFVTLNSNISHIRLPMQLELQATPQIYYLNMDRRDGWYATATFTLSHRRYPFSLQTIMNKVIKTDIAGSKNFVWNLSLIYSFGKKYIEK